MKLIEELDLYEVSQKLETCKFEIDDLRKNVYIADFEKDILEIEWKIIDVLNKIDDKMATETLEYTSDFAETNGIEE